MPLYDYKCACGKAFTRLLPLRDYAQEQTCDCGQIATKVLSAPRIVADYPGYNCPVTGRWIEGRAAHRENLARHGCRVLETGEAESARRYRESEDERLLNSVAETAEQLVHEMPAVKRDRLAAELESGVDVAITRN